MDVRDRGTITAFVVVITMTFLMCAGLAVDGGRLVGAKISAADHAENAARAGAQEITALRTGTWQLEPGRASSSARAYLARHGLSGVVTVSARQVTVTVTVRQRMTLLRLVGIDSKVVSATRSSDPVSR